MRNLGSAERVRTAPALLLALLSALALAAPSQAAFPGKNGRIAFDNRADVYTVNPDGTGLTRLTNDPARDVEPAWSRDGRRIAFVRSSDPDRPGNIWIMNADGSGQTELTPGLHGYFSPTWSPAGEIAFGYVDRAGEHIATINSDGTNFKTLLTFPCPVQGSTPQGIQYDCGYGNFGWSPDGQEIVYDAYQIEYDSASNTFLWTGAIRPDGTGNRIIRPGGLEPDWSPDNSLIAFRDDFDGDLRLMDRNGNEVRRYSELGSYPAWSPDGAKLAFGHAGIKTMNADGSGISPVTSSALDEQPDWQPLVGPQRSDYKNAAKFCKAERDYLGDAAFAKRHGTYSKCVRQS